MVRRRTLLALAATSAGSAVGGCLSPTLPLPPPEEPDAIAAGEEAGTWELRGRCTPGATVLVRNLDTGMIDGTDDRNADGRYFLRVQAEACDQCELFEVIEGETSTATFFILEPRVNGLGDGTCPSPA